MKVEIGMVESRDTYALIAVSPSPGNLHTSYFIKYKKMPRHTLIRSPAVDLSKSPIENVLELTELYEFGPVCRLQLQLVYSL